MKDISHEFEKEYENVLSKIHRFEINCKKKKRKKIKAIKVCLQINY